MTLWTHTQMTLNMSTMEKQIRRTRLVKSLKNAAADETHRGQDPTPPTYSHHTDIC